MIILISLGKTVFSREELTKEFIIVLLAEWRPNCQPLPQNFLNYSKPQQAFPSLKTLPFESVPHMIINTVQSLEFELSQLGLTA